jgi:hypothetical protein
MLLIPAAIGSICTPLQWSTYLLFTLSCGCAFFAGYNMQDRNPLHILTFALVISLTIHATLDIKYPRKGFILLQDRPATYRAAQLYVAQLSIAWRIHDLQPFSIVVSQPHCAVAFARMPKSSLCAVTMSGPGTSLRSTRRFWHSV